MQDRAQALGRLASTPASRLSAVFQELGPISWAQFQDWSFLPFPLSHVATGVDKVGGNGISCQASIQEGEWACITEGRMVRMWLEDVGALGEPGRPRLSEQPGQASQVRKPKSGLTSDIPTRLLSLPS